MRKKAGDTLVEVTLAIGIFSMVAITIAAVISGSTSSAQSALEKTIIRQEIDAQAEALRFIQASYASDQISSTKNQHYKKIWEEIIGRAKNDKNSLEYSPNDCASLYADDNLEKQGAFAINTYQLGIGDPDDVVLTPSQGIFFTASTFPRLIHDGDNGSLIGLRDDEEPETITQGTSDSFIKRVEGIFVIPFRESGANSAYYDFYIRTCWYSAGADRPSTISTVIRLLDPKAP